MSLKCQIVLSFQFLVLLCVGQNYSYFNNANSDDGILESYSDVLVKDSSYVIGGGYFTDSSSFLVRTLDLDGEIIDSETQSPGIIGTYWIHERQMIYSPSDDSYFFYTGADIGNGTEGYLMKMNSSFDTLWTKYYDLFPDVGSTFFNTGFIADDNIVLMAQVVNTTGGNYYGLTGFVKMDLDGNLIETTVYDEPEQNVLKTVHYSQALDIDSYLFGGQRMLTEDFPDFNIVPTVFRTDDEGEPEWIWEPEFSDLWEGTPEVLQHTSGRIFCSGPIATLEHESGTGYFYTDLFLRELNAESGELINDWVFLEDQELVHQQVSAMVETVDGQILILGSQKGFPYSPPWLLKVDTLGNQLWYQEYEFSPDSAWKYRALFDIKPTPDGGFIMAGMLRHTDDLNSRWSWVLKIDACGDVEWEDCEPIAVGLEEEQMAFNVELSVYPNPARGSVRVVLPDKLQGLQKLRVEIRDQYGQVLQLMSNNELRTSNAELELDISSLSIGLYHIRLLSDEGIWTGNVMKVNQ